MRNSLRGPLRRSRRRIEDVREGIESGLRQQHKMRIIRRLTISADRRRHGVVNADAAADEQLHGSLSIGSILDRSLVHETHHLKV